MKREKLRILLMGLPGSGKTSQARLLSEYLEIPAISSGEILREKAMSDQRIKQILESGELVDNETIARFIKERTERPDSQEGFVMDGYPRSTKQIEVFDPKPDRVFYVEVPWEQTVARLAGRGRDDDNEEVVKKRWELQNQLLMPLLDYYKNLGILTVINGVGGIKKVQERIKQSL